VRSLQARMFLVFALIATLPLVALSYLALESTRSALADEVGKAHEDAATAAAGFVDVYVDDARVRLQGEARPRVDRIVKASGHRLERVRQVLRLRRADDAKGTPVRLEEVVDRGRGPVYLRVEEAEQDPQGDRPVPPAALAEEVNATPRPVTHVEAAERDAQEDGTQNPPPR